MLLKRSFALVAMTLLFALTSCQNREAEKTKDPLDESYMLIDRGSYSEAIQNLTELSKTDQRPQVRVALGSAYAARAGIKVEQYWGFLIGFKAPLVTSDNVQVGGTVDSLQKIAKQANGRIDPKDMNALGGMIRTVAVWDQYKSRVDAIPTVQGEALQDLHRAVNAMASVETPGGRLYRAILNLILFKTYVTASQIYWDKFDDAFGKVMDGDVEAMCEIDVELLAKWLNPISYHLLQTLDDLAIAYPENKKELEDPRNLVQAVYSTTKDAVKELRDKRMCR